MRLNTVYTIDTLERLKQLYPNTRFVWLMGDDNFAELPKWKSWEKIFSMVPIIVFRRNVKDNNSLHNECLAAEKFADAYVRPEALIKTMNLPAWTLLDNAVIDISSTKIRNGDIT